MMAVLWLLCAAILLQDNPVLSQNLEQVYVHQVMELGVEASLRCDMRLPNISAPGEGSTFQYWMLPIQLDLQRIAQGETYRDFSVSPDGKELTIGHFRREHIGLYHCVWADPTNPEQWWFMDRIGLNTQGPYFEDLWEIYRSNTIIGLSVFFGSVFISCLLILLYLNAWERRNPKEKGVAVEMRQNGVGVSGEKAGSGLGRGISYVECVDYKGGETFYVNEGYQSTGELTKRDVGQRDAEEGFTKL